MSVEEARTIAATRLKELRAVSRDELLRRLAERQETDEAVGPSGTRYQIEVQGLWDDRDQTNLRVMVSVDDGGLGAFAPVTEDFIVAPDGSFIGE